MYIARIILINLYVFNENIYRGRKREVCNEPDRAIAGKGGGAVTQNSPVLSDCNGLER